MRKLKNASRRVEYVCTDSDLEFDLSAGQRPATNFRKATHLNDSVHESWLLLVKTQVTFKVRIGVKRCGTTTLFFGDELASYVYIHFWSIVYCIFCLAYYLVQAYTNNYKMDLAVPIIFALIRILNSICPLTNGQHQIFEKWPEWSRQVQDLNQCKEIWRLYMCVYMHIHIYIFILCFGLSFTSFYK